MLKIAACVTSPDISPTANGNQIFARNREEYAEYATKLVSSFQIEFWPERMTQFTL